MLGSGRLLSSDKMNSDGGQAGGWAKVVRGCSAHGVPSRCLTDKREVASSSRLAGVVLPFIMGALERGLVAQTTAATVEMDDWAEVG